MSAGAALILLTGKSKTPNEALTTILSVVWFVYPIILLIDPEGLRWIGSTASVALVAVTDLIAKVGYGLFSTAEHSKIADVDVAEGADPRTSLHAADSVVPVGVANPSLHPSMTRMG